MDVRAIDDPERLKKINAALMARVESAMEQQGNAFSLFQTAISLENQVRRRTEELTATLRNLEVTNEDLAAAKVASENANISKTKFLAAASHDVLQPLNAAQLSISLLADMQTSDKARDLVRHVERSLETMDELLGTLIDISKLDAGVIRPRREPFRLAPLIDDIVSGFEPVAREKDLEIRVRCRDLAVDSDKTMLRRTLQNLVSNGLRYTERGGVLVAARQVGDDVQIDVVDTGCGIPADQFDLIFDEFHRGVVSPSVMGRRPAGLGLGLSVVRRMVTALDHDLALSSRVGKGTRFRLSLPSAKLAARAEQALRTGQGAAADAGVSLAGIDVLVVENDPVVRAAMIQTLETWRCRVRAASDTSTAIDTLGSSDWMPDLVMADQHLDNGDLGTRTVEAIRQVAGRDLPAIILTADPSDETEVLAASAGAEMMRKPAKRAQLRAMITHALQSKRTDAAGHDSG